MSTQGWGLGLDSVKWVSPQFFPAPDVYDMGRHMFMLNEIDNNNGVNCYQAVFMSPASGNIVPGEVTSEWMESRVK